MQNKTLRVMLRDIIFLEVSKINRLCSYEIILILISLHLTTISTCIFQFYCRDSLQSHIYYYASNNIPSAVLTFLG